MRHNKGEGRGIRLWAPWVVFTLVSAYTMIEQERAYSFQSDSLVLPYLLKDFRFYQVGLAYQHSSILKLPYFWLMGLVDTDFHVTLLLNAALPLAALILWVVLINRVVDRRYHPLVLGLVAALEVTSTSFAWTIAENSGRNIEFSLGLWFVFVARDKLMGVPLSQSYVRVLILSSVLYALVVAGDSYMLVTSTAPLVIAIIVCWLQRPAWGRRVALTLGYVVGVGLLGLALRWALNATGVVVLSHAYQSPFRIIPVGQFLPDLGLATQQMLSMGGGSIFGHRPDAAGAVAFVNLMFLLVGIFALLGMIFRSLRSLGAPERDPDAGRHFIYLYLGFTAVATFFGYVFSGLASQGADRYLTLFPLLTIVGVVTCVRHFYADHTGLRVALTAVSILEILIFLPTASGAYSDLLHAEESSVAPSVAEVTYLRDANVKVLLTGYWLAYPLRRMTNDRVLALPMFSCNQPYSFNARRDWYRPSDGPITTALMVDRSYAAENPFAQCGNDELRYIYGPPTTVETFGPQSIWLYHHDVRSRLLPSSAD